MEPRLSAEEIKDLAEAINTQQRTEHICRLARLNETEVEDAIRFHKEISDDDLREAVKFFQNFNKAMNETGKTLRSLIVTLGFTTVVGLIVVGIWTEIRNRLGL